LLSERLEESDVGEYLTEEFAGAPSLLRILRSWYTGTPVAMRCSW